MILYRITKFLIHEQKSIVKYTKRCYSSKPLWNILFFGTDEFSVSSLNNLNSELKRGKYIKTLEVVTSFKNKNNPVYEYAKKENLILHKWPIISENKDYDIGVVVSFGHLIPENIINKFPLGILNVHASLLPRWRGAAPIVHAIANDDAESGITIMIIKPNKFDIGDIVEQASIKIPADVKLPELYKCLANLGSNVLMSCIHKLPNCLKTAVPQQENGVTYAHKITPSMSHINWHEKTGKQIYALSRALFGLYPLKTTLNQIPIKLYDVSLVPKNINLSWTKEHIPGLVIYSKELQAICVQCADGDWISVKTVGIPGKKPMDAKDFRNGFMKKIGNNIVFI